MVGISVRRKAVAGVLCTAVDPAPTSQHQRGYHPREVLRNRFFCWMGMLPVLYGNIERSPMYSIQYTVQSKKDLENPIAENLVREIPLAWNYSMSYNCASYSD